MRKIPDINKIIHVQNGYNSVYVSSKTLENCRTVITYLLTPWSRVLLEKLTVCS
jgi:hypothetical protein